jgi:hypothetical protein
MTAPITTDLMLIDLGATFPRLWKRRLCEYGSAYAGADGVWTGQDVGHDMQDGTPIFFDAAGSEPPYIESVHEGFIWWLHNRGWHCVRHDADTYHLLPGVQS